MCISVHMIRTLYSANVFIPFGKYSQRRNAVENLPHNNLTGAPSERRTHRCRRIISYPTRACCCSLPEQPTRCAVGVGSSSGMKQQRQKVTGEECTLNLSYHHTSTWATLTRSRSGYPAVRRAACRPAAVALTRGSSKR